jgi:hypothetical protein
MSNPPAFPQFLTVQDVHGLRAPEECSLTGMTLRVYFAAKAMQGILSNPKVKSKGPSEEVFKLLSKTSYQIADAMLKARDQ